MMIHHDVGSSMVDQAWWIKHGGPKSFQVIVQYTILLLVVYSSKNAVLLLLYVFASSDFPII